MEKQVRYCKHLNRGHTFSAIGLHILHRACAGDAFHDSAERYPRPRSASESEDGPWTAEEHPSNKMLWLCGPAGSGKSAIAQSFCQQLALEGRLGGGFFFKRGDLSRGNAKKLSPTIAYQLALLPQLKEIISGIVEEDPAICTPGVKADGGAMPRIFFGTHCHHYRWPPRMSRSDIQQEILRSIGHATHELPQTPLQFFVASRPEPHVLEVLCDPRLHELYFTVNIEQSFDDVRKYL
ncbi:hypothetical protein DFH07DRAFT_761256 [Mycena maculata]|uniref:Nephrocystin 3-like N-terminal domain-containing protein n=1 Tax=Mycena maculata TaxID=230809 RepID=A0AAD7MJF8_9AGAR|nr:hypothetical protein DFH07DRAFT_761256 [Mycena maculata]